MNRRNTAQRKVIYEAICFLKHTKIDDLISYIKSIGINISLSTIYRNLTVLEDDNLIRKIKFAEYDVYEVISINHYHFVCIKCESIVDIDPSDITLNIDSYKSINGNDITQTDLTFYGICSKCKKLKY